MKKIRAKLQVLLVFLSLAACEKDDICVDGDTPLLVIRFYDVDNPTIAKSVPSLRVVGEGQNITVNTILDRSSDLDSIGIPLKVDETDTSFSFILNSADDDDGAETGNTDIISFNYETREVFISRACGFVANYDGVDNMLTSDTDNWIQSIEIVTPLVENSTAAHVKIFH